MAEYHVCSGPRNHHRMLSLMASEDCNCIMQALKHGSASRSIIRTRTNSCLLITRMSIFILSAFFCCILTAEAKPSEYENVFIPFSQFKLALDEKISNEGIVPKAQNRWKREMEEEIIADSREVPQTNLTVTGWAAGQLSSAGYPNPYKNNENMEWILQSEDLKRNISLKIVDLQIEDSINCVYDYLEIIAQREGENILLGRYCGVFKDRVIDTRASTVLLRFRSDENYQEKGFLLDYSLESQAGCSGVINSSEGYLTSPNFPNNYPDSSDCWVIVNSPEGSTFTILLKTLQLEPDEECSYDFVEVFDGQTKDDPLLGRFCSQDDEFTTLLSNNSKFLVHFHSDNLINFQGFQIHYTDSKLDPAKNERDLGGCFLQKEDKEGYITSPNYPNTYPSNASCIIRIQAEPSEVLTLEFEELVTEADENCDFDKIEVYDGFEPNNTLMGRFCGGVTPANLLTTRSNQLMIKFVTDDTAEFTGFNATFKARLNEEKLLEELESNKVQVGFKEKLHDATVRERESHILRCTSLNKNQDIRWLKDGNDISNWLGLLPDIEFVDNNTLWIKNMNDHLEGNYSCLILADQEWIHSTARIGIDRTAKQECFVDVSVRTHERIVTEHLPAKITCNVRNRRTIPSMSIEWEHNGHPLSTEHQKNPHHIILVDSNRRLVIGSTSMSDTGVYTCVVRDSKTNCTAKASSLLRIIPKVNVTQICGKPRVGQPGRKGMNSDRGKIVGGQEVQPGAYPWQAMIWDKWADAYCGGTLLNERWVLTAAHCFMKRNIDWRDIRIRLGKHDRTRKEPYEVSVGIAELFVHQDFDLTTFDNDIALILLDEHVSFTDHILPACIGDRDFMEDQFFRTANHPQTGFVTGWGRIFESGPLPRNLLEVRLPVVDQDRCKNSTEEVVTKNMFCAGYSQYSLEDSCKGDSGGPFVMKKNGKWFVVGIVSWGEGCGRNGKYGFYTKVSNYVSWINGLIQ